MIEYEYEYTPHINPGVLKFKLYPFHMDLLWSYIKKSTVNDGWVIDKDYNVVERGPYQEWSLYDTTKRFENEIIIPAVNSYVNRWGFPIDLNTTHFPLPKFTNFWVRISKAGEYQPIHTHTSIWTFIIWMKIPFEFENEQTEELNEIYPESGNVTICYLNSIGTLEKEVYRLGKKDEGTIILFPGKLNHIVNPYHTSDKYRISIAGNICVDSENHEHQIFKYRFNDVKYQNFEDNQNHS